MVVFFLVWPSTMARFAGLLCYLTYSWRGHQIPFSMAFVQKVNPIQDAWFWNRFTDYIFLADNRFTYRKLSSRIILFVNCHDLGKIVEGFAFDFSTVLNSEGFFSLCHLYFSLYFSLPSLLHSFRVPSGFSSFFVPFSQFFFRSVSEK